MASPKGAHIKCTPRDIIRIPRMSEDALRVLGVCARCGAFRDVTGLATHDVYAAVHERPDPPRA
ncbi:MAG: hypothetical protein ACE5JM_09980 [Armatimonadota bacterium]